MGLNAPPTTETNADASKFLSRSQRPPAPLFDGAATGLDASDNEAFLGWVGESLPSSQLSDSGTEDDPPEDLAVEHAENSERVRGESEDADLDARSAQRRTALSPRDGSKYPAWAQSVRAWPGAAAARVNDARSPHAARAGPQNIAGNPTSGGGTFRAPPPSPLPTAIERIATTAYIVAAASTFAAGVMVTLSTSPTRRGIYPVFAASARALAVYTILSALAAVAWVYAMSRNARAVVQTSTVAVPALATVAGLYSLASSLHASSSHSAAHWAMRLGGLTMLATAGLWVYVLRRRRDALGRATEMIALAVEVVKQCPPVLGLAAAIGLSAVVLATAWTIFLSRAVLEGKLTLMFTVLFSFVYLWTWSVLVALQKCIVAGIAQGWYTTTMPTQVAGRRVPEGSSAGAGLSSAAERQQDLAKSSSVWLGQATQEAVLNRFGSCCLSALVALSVRLPILLLPRRAVAVVELGVRTLAAAPTLALLDPLALSTAMILRLPLQQAAEQLGKPAFVAADRRAYRLAKLLLAAARTTCALIIAALAGTHADRTNTSASAYGYLIALIGFFVGWTVVGAAENTLSMLMDGLFVCWITDGEPKHPQAEHVFAPLD